MAMAPFGGFLPKAKAPWAALVPLADPATSLPLCEESHTPLTPRAMVGAAMRRFVFAVCAPGDWVERPDAG